MSLLSENSRLILGRRLRDPPFWPERTSIYGVHTKFELNSEFEVFITPILVAQNTYSLTHSLSTVRTHEIVIDSHFWLQDGTISVSFYYDVHDLREYTKTSISIISFLNSVVSLTISSSLSQTSH